MCTILLLQIVEIKGKCVECGILTFVGNFENWLLTAYGISDRKETFKKLLKWYAKVNCHNVCMLGSNSIIYKL